MANHIAVAFPLAPAISQAKRLIEKLRHYQQGDFPPETQQLAILFQALANLVADELGKLATGDDLSALNRGRVRRLSEMVQNLYSCVRYFEATETRRTPPSIQSLLSVLATRHLPKTSQNSIVLVRPQWEYNFEFYYLSEVLRRLIVPEILDPDDSLGLFATDDIDIDDKTYAEKFLDAVWQKFAPTDNGKIRPRPGELAVLSFAGLDTDDVLLFPILAHELGHFIDYHGEKPSHKTGALQKYFVISFSEMESALLPEHYPQGKIERYLQILLELIDIAFREILADLLAVRMLGVGFFLSLADLLDRLLERNALQITDTGYLEIGYRVEIAYQELERIGALQFVSNVDELTADQLQIATALRTILESWRSWAKSSIQGDLSQTELPPDPPEPEDWPERLNELAAEVVKRALPELQALAVSLIPNSEAATLKETFYDRVLALRDQLPPARSGDTAGNFAEIMAAAWTHELLQRGSEAENPELTAKLVSKAMELAAASDSIMNSTEDKHQIEPSHRAKEAGVLARTEIITRLQRPRGQADRLVILPLDFHAIQGASVDVRLGNWFKLSRRPRLPVLDLQVPKRVLTDQVGQEEIFLPFGKTLIIHPGDFMLAITLEFFALPLDIMAFVEGRSLLGRAGLTVATATTVAPGFKGGIVLELSNTGVVPLQLTPGLEIAQVVFLSLTSFAPAYRGSSQGQIRP